MPEKQLFFDSNGYALFGVLYTPGAHSPAPATGYLVCHPFAEEKKAAQNVLVEIARTLCDQGFPVFLFDLRGCGDSQGDLSEATLSAWQEDIANAAMLLKQRTHVQSLGAVGVRLGAFLCATHRPASELFDRLVLIEPVLDPARYLKQSLKSKLVKELLTTGSVHSNRNALLDDLENNVSIDFDGHAISPAFYHDVQQCKGRYPDGILSGFAGELLILPVSVTGKVSSELQGQLTQAANRGKACRVVLIKMEPFWLRLESPDCRPLVQAIPGLLQPAEAASCDPA